MKEEENIAGYLQRVAEVANTIRGLGEDMPEEKVVEKILRSLTPRFDSKVSAIEELKELNTLTTEELYGILTTYEMRIESNNIPQGELAFKRSKKKVLKYRDNSNYCSDDDDEEAYFT